MSSANLMKRLELFDGVQSWVKQSEEEGAQHTSLGGPCVQCDGAGCVTADPYCLRSPGQKSNSQLHSDVLSPSRTNFMNELLRNDCVEC